MEYNQPDLLPFSNGRVLALAIPKRLVPLSHSVWSLSGYTSILLEATVLFSDERSFKRRTSHTYFVDNMLSKNISTLVLGSYAIMTIIMKLPAAGVDHLYAVFEYEFSSALGLLKIGNNAIFLVHSIGVRN